MTEKKIVLRASNIHKLFHDPKPTPILKGLNLEVSEGEIVAIKGRSGEGKSTLLHILGTLEPATHGTLQIAGYQLSLFNQSKIRNKHIGFVFQSFHLLNDLSVLDNILMPARIARVSIAPGSAAHNRALQLIEEVGLKDRTHFFVKLLSGGEKQRVTIARALLNDPDILFADEPTGNLDAKTANTIHHMLLGYAKNYRKTIVLVTHSQELADLCDKQYVLKDGILIESCSTSTFQSENSESV